MLKIILVHPDFDGSGRVDAVRILVARERIGMEAPKDMANPWAWNSLDGAAALPNAERHLQVFAAPHVHLLIVGPWYEVYDHSE